MIKTILLPHQSQMQAFFRGLKVGFLKGDPGTGKTLAMLALAESKANYKRIVWVAPNSTLINLMIQIAEHTNYICQPVLHKLAANANIVLVSYEAIQSSDVTFLKLRELVNDSFLVLDESHFIKNIEAKRTQRIISISKTAKYRFAMSGTPIGLDVYDWFSQLFALSPKIWGYQSWNQFKRYHIIMRVVNGSFGSREVMRTVHQAELIRRLKPYLYEFKKENVLVLPKKQHFTYGYEPELNTIKLYNETKRDILKRFAQYSITESVVYRLIIALHQVSGLCPSKLKATAELSIQQKCVVWCKFTHEIDALENIIGKDRCIKIDGRLKLKERQKLINKFKNNESTIVLITNQQCSGTGLNLQFVDTQIFHNQSFDFILRQQAEDRIHRLGQESETCKYYDFEPYFNIDRILQACLKRKQRIKDFVDELLIDKNVKSNDDLVRLLGEVL